MFKNNNFEAHAYIYCSKWNKIFFLNIASEFRVDVQIFQYMWFQFTLSRECKGTQELIALFWQDSEFSSSEEYWRPRFVLK